MEIIINTGIRHKDCLWSWQSTLLWLANSRALLLAGKNEAKSHEISNLLTLDIQSLWPCSTDLTATQLSLGLRFSLSLSLSLRFPCKDPTLS